MEKQFISSLKSLVKDEESALNAYREMMANRYNVTSSTSSMHSTSDDSGNIMEIAYEEKDDEVEL